MELDRIYNDMKNKEEIWKPAAGYEDFLEVSNLGNARRKAYSFIKSNGRWCHVRSCNLKLHPTRTGYLLVNAKGTKSEQIHRLVALTFIPNPNGYPEVNHKDENKANNCVENLEWCTHNYNLSYGERNRKISITLSKTQPSKRKVINSDGTCFDSIAMAARCVNGRSSNIVKCLKHQIKTAYGYGWEYVD
jgi:hypothetical protein